MRRRPAFVWRVFRYTDKLSGRFQPAQIFVKFMLPTTRRFQLVFFTLMPLLISSHADAFGFGEIRSNSHLGELLHAEIDIEDDIADHFDTSCVKLYRPGQASPDMPWLTEARLSFRRENGKGKLYISSDQPLRDPVVQIGVQSSCAGSRIWRDYTYLASPLLPDRRPDSATFVSTGSVDSLATAPRRVKKDAASSIQPVLRLTAVDAAGPIRVRRIGAIVGGSSEAALSLRMSTDLPLAETSSELARSLLRLEYRLLMAVHEQAESQLALAERLRQLEASATELKTAGLRSGAGAEVLPLVAAVAAGEKTAAPAVAALPVSAVNEPGVARLIPKAAPEALAAESSDWPVDLFIYAGLAGALLTLLIVVIRRRRVEALVESSLPMYAPTIIVEYPEFSQPPGPAIAAQLEEDSPGVAPAPDQSAISPAIPAPPEDVEVTPVMELAEIMLSFGRVNGAAQTLQEFIEANPKAALQPWMRLLDIYRDSGMRTEFEALATNLHQNFNVEIVHWDKAAPGERLEMSLELLPHIRDQIDALWGKPECFDYLQQLLRDNRNGERSGFSLPVVKEILLLIDLMVAEKAATK